MRNFILIIFLSCFSFLLAQNDTVYMLKEVVHTGTLNEMKKQDLALPIEIYSREYFLRNNINNLSEAIAMISGLQANIDGAIDGAGDIEINGWEGVYSLIMIDGNPILGGNGSLYALSSIPFQIVERIEVVKGPASTMYGSDAMMGVINVITVNPQNSASAIDMKLSTYLESTIDATLKLKQGKANGILAFSNFNQNMKWDFDKDNFTDVPLQNRVSVFNKWQFNNKYDKKSIVIGRYAFDRRYGGQLNYNKNWQGTDSIYGEYITTNRIEIFGNFSLPIKIVNLQLQTAYIYHQQTAFYGTQPFDNSEHNGRIQLTYNQKVAKQSDFHAGIQFRFSMYDDNLATTQRENNNITFNAPVVNFFPSFFIQDMVKIKPQHEIIAGLRYEYNSLYKGSTVSPRFDYKWNNKKNTAFIRLSVGSGFHTPNIFADDRIAFANGLKIIIPNDVKTELSYGLSLSHEQKFLIKKTQLKLETRIFYTAIINKIEAIKDSIPGAVIYTNDGSYGLNYGINSSAEVRFAFPLSILCAINIMKNYEIETDENGETEWDDKVINSPLFNMVFNAQYTIEKTKTSFALTGTVNSPMYLNRFENDYRGEKSPWYCLLNIQFSQPIGKHWKIYGGVNNLLNHTPLNIIMRPFDPFNKSINDPQNNPNNYRFDASYIYAPNQRIRGYLGINFTW